MSMVSCDLTQPTPSAFDQSVVFSNYTLAESNIFGIYQCLGETNCHRGRYLPYYGFNTDIEMATNTSAGDKLDLSYYDCKPNNGQMDLSNGPFTKLMEGVERSNMIIKFLRQYMTQDMTPLLGEALTARAFLYCELIKGYGEVPFRFEPVTSETAYINKAERDLLYDQLLKDLEEAVGCLGYKGYKPNRTDRVSKAFAEGLYARVALMAVGSSWRPDADKVGTGNLGSKRYSDLFQGEKKEAVLTTALRFLDDAIRTGGFSLYKDYEQLWFDFNNMDLTAGKEIMFSIPFSDSRGRWNYSFAVKDNDEFGQGGQAGPTPFLYYMYADGDLRRDISCVNWRTEKKPQEYVPAGQLKWYFGKFRFEWMLNQPYTKGSNDDGIKPVYMRLADVHLMAAEIANELGDLDKAVEYFTPVRDRAFGGNHAKAFAGVNVSSKAAMLKTIQDERAFEFVGEMLRKQDLIRWGILKERLDYSKQQIAAYANLEGIYANHGPALWYKQVAGGIEFYGLKERATDAVSPGEGYKLQSATYFKYDDSVETYAGCVYKSDINPEQHMYWPIPAQVITNSQGSLFNDYGY